MRVKIGNKVYDSHDEPIMLILEEYNKKDINGMCDDCTKYCEFPDTMEEEEIREWMKYEE